MTVAALEQQKSNAKLLIERREMALRLSRNPDFRRLILEEWMVNEAARMVQLSGDPTMNAEQRADALAMAQATGHLKRYLSVLGKMGDAAEDQMEELDQALAEAREEEALAEGEPSNWADETDGDQA